jgi:hypothetical protein
VTIQEFIDKHGIRFSRKTAYSNPNMESSEHMTRHFRCVISGPKVDRYVRNRMNSFSPSMVVYFSQGSAHKNAPTCADVLDCLASDSNGLDQSFEDWARDLGYSEDSLSAFKTYKICNRQSARLKTVLGDTAFDELLQCERM